MAEYFQSDGVDDSKVTRRTVSLRKIKGENFGVELFAVGYQTLVAKVKKFVVIDVTTQQATISCAFRIGLKFGDRLTTINGKPIVCTPELPQTIREWGNVLNNADKLVLEIDNQPFFKHCYLPLRELWSVQPHNPYGKAAPLMHALNNVPAVREAGEAIGHRIHEQDSVFTRDAKLEKQNASTVGAVGHSAPEVLTQTLADIGFECKGDRTIMRVVTNSPAFKHQLVVGNVIVQLNDASTSGVEGDKFFTMLKHCLLEERIHIVHCHVTVAREMSRGLRAMLEFYKRHKSVNEYVNETLALDSFHPHNLAGCDDPAQNQVTTVEHDVTKLEIKLKKAHAKQQHRLKPATSHNSLNVFTHPSGAVTAPNSPNRSPRGSYVSPDTDPNNPSASTEAQYAPHIQHTPSIPSTNSAATRRRSAANEVRRSITIAQLPSQAQARAYSPTLQRARPPAQPQPQSHNDLRTTRTERSKTPDSHQHGWSRFFRH